MVDADRGYDLGDTLTIGGLTFYVGPLNPFDIPILNAQIDSVYIQSDGSLWRKVGAGDVAIDWLKVLSPAPIIVTVTDTDHVVAVGTAYLRVKALTKDLTITIPTATVERILNIKVVTNPNDEFDVFLITPDASLIEDETDAVIQCEKTAVTLWANGADWEVVAK